MELIKRCQDTSKLWRYAIVYTYATWSKLYTEHHISITIKPGQSARELENQYAKQHGFRYQDVFLVCPGE